MPMVTDANELPYILGDMLRRARRSAGVTQEQLSRTTGLGRRTISLIENGRIDCRFVTAALYLSGLGLSLKIQFEQEE